jgi:hypothetical protein
VKPSSFVAGSLAFFLAISGTPAAEPLDPTLPHRVRAQPPLGPAVAERLDAAGTNVSTVRLPARPTIAFQVRLSGPIVGAPLCDERGRFLVAHGNGRLTELDALGHTT